MSAPNRRIEKAVAWCWVCGTTQTDDPDYAGRHHIETGHTTAVREWAITVWPGDDT